MASLNFPLFEKIVWLPITSHPELALRDVNESSLKYASLVGQHWSIERVGDIGLRATTLSLAFAPDGRPAIAVFDGARRQILYAIRSGDQ